MEGDRHYHPNDKREMKKKTKLDQTFFNKNMRSKLFFVVKNRLFTIPESAFNEKQNTKRYLLSFTQTIKYKKRNIT